MTWTAPEVPRTDPPLVADERTSLDNWLAYHRATLLAKCAGLTGEQLALRPVKSSTLSLLGLVRHMAEVERWWFRTLFDGRTDLGDLYCPDEEPDGDFDLVDGAAAEADFAVFASECELADRTVAGRSLDETFDSHPRRGGPIDLRWVYVHMIEEYARHNGHADLLRELTDGVTGC
ncbi:DinB family protein [Streptomyces sp. SPB162]|uniref:DinB family protein n=1 Tax=Streptomyces sp. SPB162 TaxID=2940560 RepID=UPI002406ED2E|nr:DinB family protein [Streptomyces sp. SPB162]MDF9816499.1 putative damage-inducible protein DinB [Streptomyces sp. SPB162]